MALTSAMTAAMMSLIAGLQNIAGYPIVVLDRAGNDPSVFWHQTAVKLCSVTGENWCDSDLAFITDTTAALGWSRLVTYVGRTSGQRKKVCMVLPPPPDVSPWMASQGLSQGAYPNVHALPTADATYMWLTLQAAAECIQAADGPTGDRRADAFATLGVSLIYGDPVAAQPTGQGPARLFQLFRNHDAIEWANNIAERYQFDIWKTQTAAAGPSAVGCQMTVTQSTDMAVDQIAREAGVMPKDGCIAYGGGSTQTGNITDANLWAWMYQTPISAPPKAWQPYQGFADMTAATQWTWSTADTLAKQYTQ
jgi:hypothetical protein